MEIKPPTEAPSVPCHMIGPTQPDKPCSENTCVNGHRWVPTIGVAKCPGCGAPVLMVRMENCPHCNEPCQSTRMRTDHIGWKNELVAMCRGAGSTADVGEIVMEREHWRVVEEHGIPNGYQPQIRRSDEKDQASAASAGDARNAPDPGAAGPE